MTAWPLTLNSIPAGAPARPKLPRRRRLLGIVLALAFACAADADAAESVKGVVRVETDRGFARLVFHLEESVDAQVRLSGAILVITFKKPVEIAVDRINTRVPDYVSAARRDPDGSGIRIALARKFKVNSIPAAERLYVDLLPENWTGTLPGLPQEVVDELASRARAAERQLHKQHLMAEKHVAPTIRVKVVKLPTFMRYVFDIPKRANVVPERAGGRLVLNFDQQIKWDMADAVATMPNTLESIRAETDLDSVAVVFQLNGAPEVRSFREDSSIVVDIGIGDSAANLSPGKDVTNKMTESEVGPTIEPPETMPVKDSQALNGAPAPPAKPAHAPAAAIAPAAMAPPQAAAMPAPPKPAPEPALAPKVAAMAPPAHMPVAKPEAVHNKSADPAAASAPYVPAVAAHAAQAAPEVIVKQSAGGIPPAPNPNAPVVAVANQSGNNLRIGFPFAVPTPAAVFRRADTLWLIFDSAAKIDLAALAGASNQTIRQAVSERGQDGAAIVRIRLARPLLTSVEVDGPGWVVNIGETVTVPTHALTLARNVVGKDRASIVIPFDHASKLHQLVDPDIGDRLMVITALGPSRGFLKPQYFIELRALQSTHGIVVQPIADDVTAELNASKIIIGRPGGLSLSSAAVGQQQQQMAPSFLALIFDTQVWGFDRQAPFIARQSELIRLAAAAPLAKRRQARFNLARFYLAREMAAEAKAVLDVALSDSHGADDITGSVLKAVADVMLYRPEQALKELSNPKVGSQQEAPIWRAIAFSHQGKWAEAHAGFKAVGTDIRTLPIELQRMAMQDQMRAAIEMHDFADAMRVANEFEMMSVPAELEPVIAVLSGRLYESLGRKEEALTSYRAAAGSNNRPAAAQGRLREIVMLLASGVTPRKDAIHMLETLTTVWRGDETETEGLQILAHLYTEDGRYRDAFHVMRTALLAHPNSDMTRKIQDEAAATFDSLFLAGKGDALSPIEALGLFYDFRELTPIGRRGDEMIRRLADRLVAVDLLDQAAELLQHQVDHRLQGAARSQVAARLAIIYLMARKPVRALATLQKTRMSDLPNELRDQRLLLEARAMSDTGRHELALEVIATIKGREAIHLRANILWAAKQWRRAAEQIELIHGDRWRQFTPLNESERSDILRAAIGYALSDEQIGLLRLREKYAAKMAEGPDRNAFDVVTTPIGSGGPEFEDVARKVAATNTLDAFLRDLRARYPDHPAPAADAGKDGAKDDAKDAVAPPAKSLSAAKPPVVSLNADAEKLSKEAKALKNTPSNSADASTLAPEVPAGTPLKPDRTPTGSIGKLKKSETTRP